MMTDMISRNEVMEIAMKYCPDDDGTCSKAGADSREMLDEIESIPSADVQPVKYTENLSESAYCDLFICKNCGIHLQDWTKVEIEEYSQGNNGIIYDESYEFRFCPECGAKIMNGGAENA